MGQCIVMEGLVQAKEQEDVINSFFSSKGWGKVSFVMELKTLPGHGGSGGRNDTIMEWSGSPDELGKLSVQRLGLQNPPRGLEDYIDNNKDIIPKDVLERLNEMRGW